MSELDDRRYPGLDEALVPLHLHLAALVPPTGSNPFAVEELGAEMPIELDVLDVGDRLALGSSPPLYYLETGFPAAPHRLRVRIVAEDRSGGEEEGP